MRSQGGRRRRAHRGAGPLVLFLALGLGCSSARSYRANPLADFLANKQYRVEDPDFMLTVGRLGRSEILRVLGSKSGPLASSSVVVHMRLTAVSGHIGLNRAGIRLIAAEDLHPLSSEEVLAAVSLPASIGSMPPPTAVALRNVRRLMKPPELRVVSSARPRGVKCRARGCCAAPP